METVSLTVLASAIVWLLACLAVIGLRLVRHKHHTGPAGALLLGGVALLGVSPLIGVLASELSGAPRPAAGIVAAILAGVLLVAAVRARRYRLDPVRGASSMSFREKSDALVFAAICVVYGAYFVLTLRTPAVVIPGFISATVVFVLAMIAGHIVIALLHVPIDEANDSPDERDRSVSLLSIRNAHVVMAVGIWAVPVVALLSANALVVANSAFAVFIASELVHYGSRVVYYRVGTD